MGEAWPTFYRVEARSNRGARGAISEHRRPGGMPGVSAACTLPRRPAATMALCTLNSISKAFDANRPLLRDVTFSVRDEDRIGLIGPNGCGKSTLLRMVAGLEVPDAGERIARRGLRIGYLEQEPAFEPQLSVREVVRAGLEGRDELLRELDGVHTALAAPGANDDALERLMRRQERLNDRLEELGGHDVEHLVDGAIDGVGLPDPDAKCGTLSGGEARRVALARLLVSAPDLALLDEPTNHLDAFVIAWLEKRLTELRVPLVLVTHDRYLLDRVVDRIVEVDQGKLYFYEGGYGKYLKQREARLAAEARSERSRLNLLRRETEWMRRGPLARTSKSKARIDRFYDLVDGKPEARTEDLELSFPPGPRLGTKVIALRGVTHRYGDRVILPPIDLELENGMRLGVVGPNGAGKTTLLRILLGTLTPTAGEVVVGETVRVATVDQTRSDLDDERTVTQEVAGAGQTVRVGNREIHVASFLDRFLFPGERKDTLIGSLSGGERGRVLLAKLLLAGGNVLVLDEPTNDLDLMTLRALEEALEAFAGSVVVVSHDRWFLDRVATHVLHLDGHGGARLHTGDVTSLLARLASENAEADAKRLAANAKKAKPAASPAGGKAKRLAPWEERELEELTASIEALEQQLGTIDAKLADPGVYQGDGSEARSLQGERDRANADLEQAMERWEALAERAG